MLPIVFTGELTALLFLGVHEAGGEPLEVFAILAVGRALPLDLLSIGG
jgi:hypothetical protein